VPAHLEPELVELAIVDDDAGTLQLIGADVVPELDELPEAVLVRLVELVENRVELFVDPLRRLL